MINVLIEIKTKDLDDIKVKKESDTLTKEMKKALKDSSDGKWKAADKGEKYQILDLVVNDIKDIDEIKKEYNTAKVLGAWDWNGEIIIAPDPGLLDYCHDDVVYDEDGNEVSRTPATELKQTHKWLGQKDRKFI